MPKFALSSKYTPEALAAVREAGYASREAVMKSITEQLGGKLLSQYWISSPDYDFVAIAELPSADDAFALLSMSDAGGASVRNRAIELRTSAEADAAIAKQLTWTPPGS